MEKNRDIAQTGLKQLFISYSSSDFEKVRAIVNVLERQGFCCWHDYKSIAGKGISYGDKWWDTIEDAIERSGAFLAFLSRGFSRREVALQEVEHALRKRAQDPSYRIVFVFLEPVQTHIFSDVIRQAIFDTQVVRYWKEFCRVGFLSRDFVNRLTGADWPECIIDQDRRRTLGMEPWQRGNANGEEEKNFIFATDALPERSFHRLSRSAVLNGKVLEEDRDSVFYREIVLGETKKLTFYRLSPDDIEKTTVYPMVMDDQWVPPAFYDPTPPSPNAPNVPPYDAAALFADEFRKHGMTSETVMREVVRRQRQEIIRCLLHNWQIVVNRAFIVNSDVFRQWYTPGSEDYAAFRSLIGDDSIVVFLHNEEHPLDKPTYASKPENFALWEAFCLDVSQDPDNRSVACLRLDWNGRSNDFETKSLLGYRFQEYCLTTAENPERMHAMMSALGVHPEKYFAFRERWRAVEADVIAWTRNHDGRPYTRSRFYESFITPYGHKVSEGRIAEDKAFAVQFKQVIDFRYNLNLTGALQIQPAFPPQSRMNSYLIARNSDVQRQRELSQWELIVAVEDFSYDVLHNPESFLNEAVWLPETSDFALRHLSEIRASREWQNYMRELAESKTRSRLNEPDFFNIGGVWREHRAFLAWMREQERFSGWNWRETPGALSVIYHFEEIRLVSIYRGGTLRVFCPDDEDTVALSRKEGSLSRKTGIYIDYICGDVDDDSNWENLLLTEIRLFEGMTYESGREVFDALRASLNAMR